MNHKLMNQGLKLYSQVKPPNSTVLAYKAILLHDLGRSIDEPLQSMRQLNSEDGATLAADLANALQSKLKTNDNEKLSDSQNKKDNGFPKDLAIDVAADLKSRLLPSWYRESALTSLYINTNQPQMLDSLLAHQSERNNLLVWRAWAVILLGILGVISGSLLILVQATLLLLKRLRVSSQSVTTDALTSVKYGAKAVYGVLIAYLFVRLLFRYYGQLDWLFDSNKLVENFLLIVLLSTASFLASMGTAFACMYFCCMRPKAIKFADGINLRWRTAQYGPWRLILYGVAAFLASYPIVGLSTMIVAFLGFHSSANPAVLLVAAAARSSDVVAIACLYLLMAVIGPIAEEAFVRGFLYSSLRQKWGIIPAMLGSSTFFAAYHFDPNGFIQIFMLGLLFTFAFERTKSIVPGVIAHGLYNGSLLTYALLLMRDY